MNKLNEFQTTEYSIYPNFGIAEFFEFVITNPFNEDHLVTIFIEDPEIQVVTDVREWRHLKLINQIYSQVEENMFHRQELADPSNNNAIHKFPQVFLRAKETINVPFKFQTFKVDNTLDVENSFIKINADAPSSIVRNSPAKYELRKTNIYFRTEDKNPIAILRLVIDQQPHVVNQTFRFNECEHTFLKKTIRFPSSARALASSNPAGNLLATTDIKISGTANEQGTSQVYVRTSDPNAICESRAVNVGEPHDIFIKSPTPASPYIKKFYLAIYADQYLAVPLEIWQIYVHSVHRIDVSCSQGQTSRFSLILK